MWVRDDDSDPPESSYIFVLSNITIRYGFWVRKLSHFRFRKKKKTSQTALSFALEVEHPASEGRRNGGPSA